MKERITRAIIASLLILAMTMSNFILLGITAVTYAVDSITQDKTTNNKNVEFMAYFKDSNQNIISSREIKMNETDLKLYFKIAVKREGYFNGQVELSNSNFKINETNLEEKGISKIEGNTIYLNQINAGEEKEYEIGIELFKDDMYDLSMLQKDSQVSISGTYKDSTEKDISIEASRTVTLKLMEPYADNEQSPVSLEQKVITNKVYDSNGRKVRVLQVQIDAKLLDNNYPIKSAKLELTAPKVNNKYPEIVELVTPDELMTNGKKLSEDQYKYDKGTGLLTATVENTETDGKVVWTKSGTDTYVVTYIFSEEESIQDQRLIASVKYELYNDSKTSYTKNIETPMMSGELDSTIEVKTDSTDEIYKGKLYAGLEKEYSQNIHIQVNTYGIAESIYVAEDISQMRLQTYTKQIKLNKDNMISILGDDGKVTILNKATSQVISEITKDSQANEQGNITIDIPANIPEIAIQTTKPTSAGVLDITSIRVIAANAINTVKSINELPYVIKGNYMIGNIENAIKEVSSNIELKETQTSARLEVNKEELSTMTTNKNVEMKVILETANESQELYKAPTIRVTLPDKIQDIQINAINLINEDELQIASKQLIGKTIEIQLQNEQTKYKDIAVEGAEILISADLTLDKKETNSTEQITLTYTNQKAVNYKEGADIGTDSKPINIVSYAGIVTVNEISDYGIQTINNDGTKQGKLELGKEAKTTTIKSEIYNNQDAKINNVRILGTFPTQGASDENNIETSVSKITLEGPVVSHENENIIAEILANQKAYYTENENADTDLENQANQWEETIKDPSKVKKYMIVIDSLDIKDEISFEYNLTIPANLEYNQTAKTGYDIYYTIDTANVEQVVNTDKLTLETGVGPIVNAELQATVGGQEITEVKKGEFIHYTITARNTGSEPVENVKLIGEVPEGTVYIEEVIYSNDSDTESGGTFDLNNRFSEDLNKTQVEFTVEKLDVGEQVVKTYDVKVKDVTSKTAEAKVNIQYGEVKKQSNVVKLDLEDSEMEINIKAASDNTVLNSGYTAYYIIQVLNNSDKVMKNTKVVLQAENLKVRELAYFNDKDEAIAVQDSNEITVDEIQPNKSIDITATIEALQFVDSESKQATLQANAISDDITYHSNQQKITAVAPLLQLEHSAEREGEYVKAGEQLAYKIKVTNKGENILNEVTIEDNITLYEKLDSIAVNETQLKEDEYTIEKELNAQGQTITIKTDLQPQESKEYTVITTIDSVVENKEVIELSNKAKVYSSGVEIKQSELKHLLEPDTSGNEDPSNPNNGNGLNGQDGNGQNGNESGSNSNKIISGIAWLDKNENNEKDTSDSTVPNMTVKLLDTTTNQLLKDSKGQVIETKTNETGFYSLSNIPQGRYMVIFEYDTSKYGLVEYQKDGVSEENNSNVIAKQIEINGANKQVASTELIELSDKNVSNINIGLKELKIYDMRLDKYVSRIVVNNSKGASTNEYGESTLAKAEIPAKLLSQSNVVVEYKIKVTNEGEIPGYIKKIDDKIATDYKFSSEMNKDWYQSGDTLSNVSLANTRIEPGESKEITLILTKQMTENNTGLINNTAEIAEDYNEQGIVDADSVAGNKDIKEDDFGSADVILGIKTGEIIMTIAIIITSIVVLAAGAFIIAKIVLKKRVI